MAKIVIGYAYVARQSGKTYLITEVCQRNYPHVFPIYGEEEDSVVIREIAQKLQEEIDEEKRRIKEAAREKEERLRAAREQLEKSVDTDRDTQ